MVHLGWILNYQNLVNIFHYSSSMWIVFKKAFQNCKTTVSIIISYTQQWWRVFSTQYRNITFILQKHHKQWKINFLKYHKNKTKSWKMDYVPVVTLQYDVTWFPLMLPGHRWSLVSKQNVRESLTLLQLYHFTSHDLSIIHTSYYLQIHTFLLFCYQYWYIYTHTTCTAVWKTEFFYITLERDLFCSMYMTCELLRGWHSTAHWSYTKSAGHIYSLHCCVTYVKQTNKLYLLYVYVTGIEEA